VAQPVYHMKLDAQELERLEALFASGAVPDSAQALPDVAPEGLSPPLADLIERRRRRYRRST
jgi:hypothetical protein